jgi:hypothetical protein
MRGIVCAVFLAVVVLCRIDLTLGLAAVRTAHTTKLGLCRVDFTSTWRDLGIIAAKTPHATKLRIPTIVALRKATALTAISATGAVDGIRPETLIEGLDQPVKRGLHISIKGKVLNLWGILSALVLGGFALVVFPFIFLASCTASITGNGKVRAATEVF